MTEPPFHYPHEEGQPPPETHQEQTEQFPVPPPAEPSFWQRYRATLLAAAVVAVVVVAGLVWAIAGSSTSSAAPPPPAPTSPAPTSGAPDAKHHPMLRGTITAQDGDTWTVKTDGGDTVSVTITDKTKFGSEKEPVDKAKITVNSKVIITGKNTDGKVDARRIRVAKT